MTNFLYINVVPGLKIYQDKKHDFMVIKKLYSIAFKRILVAFLGLI